jgi:hypothetical protein
MRDAAAVNAMLCPVCKIGLAMSDRQGIEIDYCPQCRGVWLDRGELDKIVERSMSEAPAPAPVAPPAPSPAPQQPYPQSAPWGGGYDQRQGYDNRGHHDPRYHGKRKKSFLENLFD